MKKYRKQKVKVWNSSEIFCTYESKRLNLCKLNLSDFWNTEMQHPHTSSHVMAMKTETIIEDKPPLWSQLWVGFILSKSLKSLMTNCCNYVQLCLHVSAVHLFFKLSEQSLERCLVVFVQPLSTWHLSWFSLAKATTLSVIFGHLELPPIHWWQVYYR